MSDNSELEQEAGGIAIVGMAGRFPGANSVAAFWQNLRDGVECLRQLTDEELEAAGVDPDTYAHPNYVKVAGVLDGVEDFDAGFFGFSPRDASILDPQHRHFLECCWEAFEDAGVDPNTFDGTVGVFAGSGHNAYMPYNLLTNPALVDSVGFFLLRHTGNDKDFMTTRVSYLFDLKGPSLNIQTACSTSAVAAHMACQSLLNGECDMALAGGVTIEMPHGRGYMYEEGEILSPDGHCRAFDAQSKGTVFGSGAGVVLLKRLEDAIEDGDLVHAVILGSAVNNDGAMKVGYLAPSVEGQSAAMSEALALAEVDADSITYIEAHGTGTPVGDPIEVAALTQAFGDTEDKQYCGLGSVKTNIGHLDTAAGVASLIKVASALEHKQIPPSLHFQKPNPVIEFDSSPFYVNAELKPWPDDRGPRRAAVNSLGVGGTNAFLIVEEAPAPQTTSGPSRPWQLILQSARTVEALDAGTERLAAHLAAHPDISLADTAYTLKCGRRAFPHRRMLVTRPGGPAGDVAGGEVADAQAALASRDPQRVYSQQADERSVAFVFPGGGAQYPNMGREIYDTEPVFREQVDACLAMLDKRDLEFDLKPLLYPDPDDPEAVAAAAAELEKGSRSLPALFITEYALAKLWMSWGITPTAMLGHSMGEYVAACLAGVFTPEEGLSLVLKRGLLFETIEIGTMLSVPMGEAELRPYLGDKLDIAAINGPSLAVASGRIEDLRALEETLRERGIDSRRVKIEVAAHSRMLDPILAEFRAFTDTIKFQKPELPILSNVSGTWMTEEQATNPQYWVDHLRNTVQFSANLDVLLEDKQRVVLEVAPGRTLSTVTKAHPAAGLGRPIFNSMRHVKDDVSDMAFLLNVVGRLWLTGVEFDWNGFYDGQERCRVRLPTYAFDHRRYWIDPGKSQVAPSSASLKKKTNISDWFYQPSWRRALLAEADAPSTDTDGVWLLYFDDGGLGDKIAAYLGKVGAKVVTVRVGDGFERDGEWSYRVRADSGEDADALIGDLASREALPRRILHLLAVGRERPSYEESQARGFFSLLSLLQALGKEEVTQVELGVVTSHMQRIAGESRQSPEWATVLGPVKVGMQEFSWLSCRSIDIADVAPDSWQESFLVEQLPREMMLSPRTAHSASSAETVSGNSFADASLICYRGHERFVQSFERVHMPKAAETGGEGEGAAGAMAGRLRQGGVYLITGGLGGLGLFLAEHLAQTRQAKLVLVSRSGRKAGDAAQDAAIARMEAAGAEVMVAAADVTNLEAMQTVVADARARFGTIHGVYHTAGVIDDGVIQLKEADSAVRVLAPKVRGTLALDGALAASGDDRLDFLVLFSSVSAFTGLAGQVDYAAANAFLDAYAQAKSYSDGTFVVSVDWNAWQQVGMAANMARELGIVPHPELPPGTDVDHPLLDRRLGESTIYASLLDSKARWVLDEHRIKGGAAIIPGTGYVELARAALAATDPGHAQRCDIEIRDLMFMAPFAVADGETRHMRVALQPGPGAKKSGAGPGYELEISAVEGQSGDGDISARGMVAFVDKATSATINIDDISARCDIRQQDYSSADDENLDFGPRWNNRKWVRYGKGEALVSLALPGEFASDCGDFQLHPALMDFATAGAQGLIDNFDAGKDFYVPLSYGRLQMRKGLTPEVFSHIRYRSGANGSGNGAGNGAGNDRGVAIFDITIADPKGEVLVTIDEFVMRRVEDRAVMSQIGSSRSEVVTTSTGNRILELGLAEGIMPAEGMEALDRLLAGPPTAQLIVSSQDLYALIASTMPVEAGEGEAGAGADGQAASTKLARPPLANAYVAPENELQTTVAGVWEELLGIDGVGIHDDFFDLGGHSLLLTQLVSRVRKRVEVEVSLRTLFEKRTVAGIAEEIQKAKEDDASGKKGPTLKRVSRDKYRVKRTKE